MRKILMIPAFFVFISLISCSKAEPRINYGFIELTYYSGYDIPQERFSFFILCEDDDGIENLSELYLYNDREGLRWLLKADDWVLFEEEGKTWIGSRHIAMTDNASLPRGQYRAVLVNKGGEKTERNFTYDGPEEPPHPFPYLSVMDGVYRVDSRYPLNRFLCYDQQGKVIHTISINDPQGNIRDLRLPNSVRSAALWAEDPEYRISALTEAVSLR